MEFSNTEKYSKIIERLNNFGKVLGLDILLKDEDTPANFLLKFAISNAVLYVTSIIYSTYVYYGDFLQTAICLTTFGIVIDSIMKFYVCMYQRRDLHKVMQDMRDLLVLHASDFEANEKLGRIVRYASIACSATFLCFVNTVVTLNGLAIMESLRTGVKTLVFNFHLPLVDHTSNLGFTINFLYQSFLGILVIFHSSQTDGFFVIHMILACARLEALTHQIDLLDRYLVDPDRVFHSPREDDKIISRHIRDILEQHLIHIKYMKQMESLYSTYSFLLVTSCMFMIIVNIFVLVSALWIAGICLCFLTLMKIMAFCVLGSVVSFQNDKYVDKLYNMRWYLMPNEYQKATLMILRSAQKPVELTMMKFKELSLNTFLKCLKMIYSISAMLLTMVRKKEL